MSKNKREQFKRNRKTLDIDGDWETIADELAKERDLYKVELLALKSESVSNDIIEVAPSECKNWIYSDRNDFELGDIEDLAEDIKKNGQLQPAILRKIDSLDFNYEVIAGERRWTACGLVGINLKALVVEKDDLDCLVIQTSENKKHGLSPFSFSKVYFKLMKDRNISQNELSKRLGIPQGSFSNLMAFNKVPQKVWDNVVDMSKVSPKTAAFLVGFCDGSEDNLNIAVELASKIREGIGKEGLQKLIDKKLLNSKTHRNNITVYESDAGKPLFRLSSKGRISISNSVLNKIDINEMGKYLKSYLEEIV